MDGSLFALFVVGAARSDIAGGNALFVIYPDHPRGGTVGDGADLIRTADLLLVSRPPDGVIHGKGFSKGIIKMS